MLYLIHTQPTSQYTTTTGHIFKLLNFLSMKSTAIMCPIGLGKNIFLKTHPTKDPGHLHVLSSNETLLPWC